VTAQFATQAAVNANLTDVLASALAAQAEQAVAQAAAMSNVTDTLAAVLGGLSTLQAGVGALAARMEAVEANTGLLDSLVVSPPMPPPGPSPPPPPPPFPGRNQFTCSAVNDPVVCSALGDLYYSTNGAGWTNPAGWSSAANGVPTDFCSFYQWGGGMAGPPCDTHGVLTFLCVTACQVVQRHLTPLPLQSNLYNNNLAGTIPSTLGNILSLTALCVRHSLRLSAR